ncbi:MAG: hypothetical protein K9M99_02985 [Candidatus Cloacimonetes bacterium]|nr:hypothetical protein [Candidatus Cloacimonadota bacterium]
MKLKEKLLALDKEKASLLGKIYDLNKILLDANDPENAKTIGALEEEKSILNRKFEAVTSERKALIAKIDDLKKQISDISSDEQVNKLLAYFKDTRWFFFENKKMLIFDKWTGMLWGNVENFDCPEETLYGQAAELIKKIKWHNLAGWRLPEVDEVPEYNDDLPQINCLDSSKEIVKADLLIAFGRGSYTILTNQGWVDTRKNNRSAVSYYTSTYNPCNPKFKTNKYKPAPKSDFISDKDEKKKIEDEERKVFALISFFIEQDWVPKFKDKELAAVYKAYVEKPILLEKLAAINEQIASLSKETKSKTITAEYDYQVPLLNYKLDEINNSALQYYRSSVKWINNLIKGLDDFGNENNEFFSKIEQIQVEMTKKYQPEPDFTEAENKLFSHYHSSFQSIFDFDFDIVKQQLYGFKEEAETQLTLLKAVSSAKDKITSLARIEKQERPDFRFFAEYTGEMLQEKLKKFVWYQEENKQIDQILAQIKEWYEDYQVFADKTKQDYFEKCEADHIDKESYTLWFEDWRKERFLVITKVFSLVSESFMPRRLAESVVLSIMEAAVDYREQLDSFYESERTNIYQKFAFQAGGELQDKFEKEIELAKITSKFTEKLQKIMFEGSSAEKIFILRWANAWFDSQIEQIVLFAEQNQLSEFTPVFTDAVNKLRILQKQNMEVFLNDIQTFSKMVKKRNDEYNALMFKMRKELMKGKKK